MSRSGCDGLMRHRTLPLLLIVAWVLSAGLGCAPLHVDRARCVPAQALTIFLSFDGGELVWAGGEKPQSGWYVALGHDRAAAPVRVERHVGEDGLGVRFAPAMGAEYAEDAGVLAYLGPMRPRGDLKLECVAAWCGGTFQALERGQWNEAFVVKWDGRIWLSFHVQPREDGSISSELRSGPGCGSEVIASGAWDGF